MTTAGRPSGTAATAMLTAVRNISVRSSPRSTPVAEDDADEHERDDGQRLAELVEPLLQRRGLPLDGLDEVRDAAQFGAHAGGDHDGLAAAVGHHRAHEDQVAPIAERQVGIGEGLADLSTGSDSPVSDASWARRLTHSSRRQSAGTRLPASSSTMSPGTRSRDGISMTCPPRRDADDGHRQAPQHGHGALGAPFVEETQQVFSTTMARIAIASL